VSILTRAALPAVAAATLLAGSASVASAAGSAPPGAGASTTVSQEAERQRPELTPEQICTRVAGSDKPHPVLSVLCRLYADPTLPPEAKEKIGHAIVTIVKHRLDRLEDTRDRQEDRRDRREDRRDRPGRPRPFATATPTPAS
jgi:hypothetical protein